MSTPATATAVFLLCLHLFFFADAQNLADPNAYTCLAPIVEGEGIEDSMLWTAIAKSYEEQELLTDSDGVHSGVKGLQAQDKLVLKLLDSKVQAECASGKAWKEPIRDAAQAAASAAKRGGRKLKGFEIDLGRRNKQALKRFSKGHAMDDAKHSVRHDSIGEMADKAVAKIRKQEGAIEKALRPGPSRSHAPVSHEGEACGAFTSTRSARLVCMAVAATSSVASHVRKQHLKGLKSSPGAPPSLAASASPPWLRAWSTRTCPPWSAVRSRARSTCARWGSGAAGVGSRRKPAIADSAAPSAPRSSSRARPVDSVRSVFGRRSAHSRTHVQRTLRDQNYALKAATARTE